MHVNVLKEYIIKVINGIGFYWYGKNENNCVALTFDDGPDEKYTPIVLDLLKSAHIRATFFLVGEKIQSKISLVKRMINEGHEIGNHTYSHSELPGSSWQDIKLEISKTDKILKDYFNLKTDYLRLPKGNWRSLFTILIGLFFKKKLIFWSVDPMDFEAKSSEEIISRLKGIGIKSGDIILLHDKRDQTVKALDLIVQELNDKDLRPVTLSKLLMK